MMANDLPRHLKKNHTLAEISFFLHPLNISSSYSITASKVSSFREHNPIHNIRLPQRPPTSPNNSFHEHLPCQDTLAAALAHQAALDR